MARCLYFVLIGLALVTQKAIAEPAAVISASKTGELAVGSQVEVTGQAAGKTDWIVSVIREMKPTLSGRITVPAPKESMISSADLSWRVDGTKVTGTVQDPDGKTLATFEGTATSPTTVEGTFTTSEGATAPWSWEGTPANE